MPKTQLFGIGFGQNGSTSNFGTIDLAVGLSDRFLLEQLLADAEHD